MLGWYPAAGGGGHPCSAFWHSTDQRWCAGRQHLKSEGYFSPTHWMPLPPDPREARS
jgi:hypothetical protein